MKHIRDDPYSNTQKLLDIVLLLYSVSRFTQYTYVCVCVYVYLPIYTLSDSKENAAKHNERRQLSCCAWRDNNEELSLI